MKKIALLFLSGAVLFTACGNNSENDTNYSIENNEISYIDIDQNLYANGLIYMDAAYNSSRACFLDYETMEGIPLCNKPNCMHKDTSCIAFQCVSTNTDFIHFVYHDTLYWLESNYKIVDSDDGKSTQPDITSTLHCANLSTGETKIAAEIDDLFTDAAEALLIDNTLYIICSYSMHQMNDGTWTYNGRSQEQYLYAINLDTNDIENLGYINDSPYVINSYVENGNSYGTNYTEVLIDGVYNGKIYMHYRYMENKEDMLAYIEETFDADGETYVDDSKFPWVYEVKYYDLETSELSLSDLPYAVLVTEDSYVYETEDEYCIVIGSDASSAELPGCPYAYLNGYYWIYYGKCYLPEQNKTYTLSQKYKDGGARVLDYVNGQYIVRYTDADGNITYDQVTFENLVET